MQPRTPGEPTRETWRLRPGFGVVVSLGERDWTNILQEEEGDAKDFPLQLLLGVLHNLGEGPFSFCVACAYYQCSDCCIQSDSELLEN